MNNALYRLKHYRERISVAFGTLAGVSIMVAIGACAAYPYDHVASAFMTGFASGLAGTAFGLLAVDALDDRG